MKSVTRISVLVFLLIIFFGQNTIFAQQFSPTVGISVILKASDQNEIRSGLIVAKDPKTYYLTRSYKDPNVAGVITENTDFLYTIDNGEDRTTLAVDGVTDVWVSNELGTVKYGDFITTSTETGIGVKAIENGSVVGYAMEATPDGDGPHLIKVKLTLTDSWAGEVPSESNNLYKESGNTLTRLLENAGLEAQESSRSFLYIIVLIIVILASIFGFFTFGRIAVNGIYAVGRNPLAKSTIVRTILINSFITILFTLASLVVALLIIK